MPPQFAPGALAGLKVLDLTRVLAGPTCTQMLGDLGAEIIKIEDPRVGGDVGRYVPPYMEEEDSLFFETFNRNKQSISLDIKTPAGREVFDEAVTLLAECGCS